MSTNRVIFIEGLDLIFSRWTALKLAIDNGWGGPNTLQKSIQLKSTIISSFDKKGSKVEQEDIEDLIIDFMNNELCIILEDSSEIQIAQQILSLYKEAISGKRNIVNSLSSIPLNNNPSKSQTGNIEEFSVTESDTEEDGIKNHDQI